MDLSPPQRRLLRIIDRNVILSQKGIVDDVIDPSTGKRVVPEEVAERFIQDGLAEWVRDESYQEYRLVLTDQGRREADKSDEAS